MAPPTGEEKAQAECLDALEQLREARVGTQIPLPQIVVVGDQSSGKSSIIERLTGAAIPSKEGLCTRNPMLLSMRFGQESSINVRIIPAEERRPFEKIDLLGFHRTIKHLSELGPVFEEVAGVLGINQASAATRFCKDVLKIDFTGPKNLNLALVDLPGLFQIGNRRQTKEDAEYVKEMVEYWIAQPRTVKLVVISAKTEPVQHYSLKFLQELSQQYQRSIGVITHADHLIDQGSANFQDYAAVLAGNDQKLQYGWFILNNQAAGKGSPLEQQVVAEADYFIKQQWQDVAPSVKGIKALEQCLLRVQFETITECLPSLIEEAKTAVLNVRGELDELSSQKHDLRRLKKQISATARSFEEELRRTKDNPNLSTKYPALSLRYNVQQTMTVFVNALRDATDSAISHADDGTPSQIVQRMRAEMQNSSALPGQLDPEVMSEVFYDSTLTWKTITGVAIDDTVRDTRLYLLTVMDSEKVVNGKLLDGFDAEIVEPAMKELRDNLQSKVNQVLRTHKSRSPISFYTTARKNIGITRGLYVCTLFTKELGKIQGGTTPAAMPKSKEEMGWQMTKLAEALEHAAIDVDAFAENESEVCLRTHIADESKNLALYFNFETVMREIDSRIPQLFTIDTIEDHYEDSNMLKLCKHNEISQAKKSLLEKKIDALESAIKKLQRFRSRQSHPSGIGQKRDYDTTEEETSTVSDEIEMIDDDALIGKWTGGRGSKKLPKTPTTTKRTKKS